MSSSLLLALLAALTGTIAVARATRLITSDAYPPAERIRRWWVSAAGSRSSTQDWAPLLECPFCFAPYAAAINLGWALAVQPWELTSADPWSVEGWWWVVNAWAAISYLASMIVVRDEPPEEE